MMKLFIHVTFVTLKFNTHGERSWLAGFEALVVQRVQGGFAPFLHVRFTLGESSWRKQPRPKNLRTFQKKIAKKMPHDAGQPFLRPSSIKDSRFPWTKRRTSTRSAVRLSTRTWSISIAVKR